MLLKINEIIKFITISISIFAVLIFFIILLCSEIKYLNQEDLQYSDVSSSIYTFKNYECIHGSRASDSHHIYVRGKDKPFYITSIVMTKEIKNQLKNIPENSIVKIYYKKTNYYKSDYEIVEMKYNNKTIFNLDHYNKKRNNNAILGLVISSVAITSISGYYIYFTIKFKNKLNEDYTSYKKKSKSKQNNKSMNIKRKYK